MSEQRVVAKAKLHPPSGARASRTGLDLRAHLLCVLLLSTGCVRMNEASRIERGPLLKTFEREQVVEGGVTATVEAKWPTLFVRLEGYDTCRVESVEEYAEEHITERNSNTTGAALSAGIVGTLAGAVLLALSPALSNAPATGTIDAGGRYGPSTRQYAQAYGIGALVVGVPALAVGVVTYFSSGESSETKKVEQVASQKEARCRERKVDGPLQLFGDNGESAVVKIAEGTAQLDAKELKGPVDHFGFYGRQVELDDEGRALLDAFSACAQLEAEGATPVTTELNYGALMSRQERVRACRRLRPQEMETLSSAYEQELAKRREGTQDNAVVPTPNVSSFEGAVSAYAPKLTLTGTSPDLVKLDASEALVGQSVFLKGVIAETLAANIAVVQIGERAVYLFLPSEKSRGADAKTGNRIEAVALVASPHTVDGRTLPLLRAIWVRPAFGN